MAQFESTVLAAHRAAAFSSLKKGHLPGCFGYLPVLRHLVRGSKSTVHSLIAESSACAQSRAAWGPCSVHAPRMPHHVSSGAAASTSGRSASSAWLLGLLHSSRSAAASTSSCYSSYSGLGRSVAQARHALWPAVLMPAASRVAQRRLHHSSSGSSAAATAIGWQAAWERMAAELCTRHPTLRAWQLHLGWPRPGLISWPSLEALYRSSISWLPSLPGTHMVLCLCPPWGIA